MLIVLIYRKRDVALFLPHTIPEGNDMNYFLTLMRYVGILILNLVHYFTASIPAVKRIRMGTLQMTPSRHRRRLKPGD